MKRLYEPKRSKDQKLVEEFDTQKEKRRDLMLRNLKGKGFLRREEKG